MTTVGALVPSLLNLFAIPPAVMWRIVSVVAGILGPIYLELYFHWRRRITQGQLYGRGIRIAVSVAVFVGLWVNATGIFFPPNGAFYALALTWFLIQAGIVFLQTLEGILKGKATG